MRQDRAEPDIYLPGMVAAGVERTFDLPRDEHKEDGLSTSGDNIIHHADTLSVPKEELGEIVNDDKVSSGEDNSSNSSLGGHQQQQQGPRILKNNTSTLARGLRCTNQEMRAKQERIKCKQEEHHVRNSSGDMQGGGTTKDQSVTHGASFQRGLRRTNEEMRAKLQEQKMRARPVSEANGTNNNNNSQLPSFRGLARINLKNAEDGYLKPTIHAFPPLNVRQQQSDGNGNLYVDGMPRLRGLRKNNDSQTQRNPVNSGAEAEEEEVSSNFVLDAGGTQLGTTTQAAFSEDSVIITTLEEDPNSLPSGNEHVEDSPRSSTIDVFHDSDNNSLNEVDVDTYHFTDEIVSTINADLETNTPRYVDDDTLQLPSDNQQASPMNSGLVEAREVQDESVDLMHAREVDPSELEKQELQEKKHRECRRIGYTLIVISLAVLLGAILGNSSTKDHDIAVLVPTVAPSMAPSEVPSAAPSNFLDLMLDIVPIYTKEKLGNISTPQWKAYNWLSGHPNLEGMQKWRLKQLYAMVSFYHALDGDNWPKDFKDNWLLYDVPECLWFSSRYGQFADLDGSYEEVEAYNITPCNAQKELQLLMLGDLRLQNSTTTFIPQEISLLTTLSVLALPENHIAASITEFIPSEVYRMTNLTILNFLANSLTGPIPTNLCQLTKLRILSLTENSLIGSMPTQLGCARNIELLGIAKNDLTGSIPSQVGMMTSMTKLFLYGNSLTGSIPTEVGAMTNLLSLQLQRNLLSGTIPSELGSLTSTTFLYLNHNGLSGFIPTETGSMINMSQLVAEDNSLSGTIPSEMGRLTNLIGMTVAFNVLTGHIPSDVATMKNLKFFYLRANSLTGSIPSEVGSMDNVLNLAANDNALNGSIPSEMGLLINMRVLWLHNNKLSGPIPSQLSLLPKIAQLDLGSNGLNGSIPKELGAMSSMQALWLNNNSLNGPIPSELAMIPSLVELNLQGNSLIGSIPSELGGISSLQKLWLNNNNLTGPIHEELSHMALNGSLSMLTLENNFLTGTVFDSLCSTGPFDSSTGIGVSFDCSEMLCGCCWCPCHGINNNTNSSTTGCQAFHVSDKDEEWPGAFPKPVNTPNVLTINMRSDQYPSEITWEWSQSIGDSKWELLDVSSLHSPQEPHGLQSYSQQVGSDVLYKLQIFDSDGDGTCCAYGFGWFTITNSTPSNDHAKGTVVWEALGDEFEAGLLEVFLHVDMGGQVEAVDYIPVQD